MAAASSNHTRKAREARAARHAQTPPEQKLPEKKGAPPRHLLQPMRDPFRPSEWVPYSEAWGRIRASVGGSKALGVHDLWEHLSAKRLIVAVRHLLQDGERWFVFLPAFWQQTKAGPPALGLLYHSQIHILLLPGGRRYYFVHRAELDKLYPVAPSAVATLSNAPVSSSDDTSDDTSPRRKPGKKPKHKWPTLVTRELIRRARAGEAEPTAPQIAQFLQDKLDWQPDIRAVQRLLRELLA